MKTESNNDNKVQWLALGFFLGMIVAVLSLEYYGYIKHSTVADTALVDEFQLLDLSTQADLKISPKDAGKIAFCADGYVLMRPANEHKVAAILVDHKKRGVRCNF